MSASRFWTATNPEILITAGGGGSGGSGRGKKDKKEKSSGGKGRGGGWTGRGGKGGFGGPPPGGASLISTELFTIAADHNSINFNVTHIDGVSIGMFSFVTVAARGLTSQGGTSGRYFGVRLSADGGSTWINGGGDYRSIWYQDTVTSSGDQGLFRCLFSTTNGEFSCLIKNLNAAMPTQIVGHELGLDVVDIKRWAGMTLLSVVPHNALQFTIEMANGPVFTGGTLDLVGYQ